MKGTPLPLEVRIKGTPISRGIAIGKPFFISTKAKTAPKRAISPQDVDKEIERYRQALKKAHEDIKRIQEQLEKENILEGAAILGAQLQMLQDPLLVYEVEKNIRDSNYNVEYVFLKVIKGYQKKINSISDPFFRERFKDIEDIFKRILTYLLETGQVAFSEIPVNSILFADELSTFYAAEASSKQVIAFVSEKGSSACHAAIVAKAKGFPYITSVDLQSFEPYFGSIVILDGTTGEIIVNPCHDTLSHYEGLRAKHDTDHSNLIKLASLPAETYDGYKVRLSANMETMSELALLHEYGGCGIGLFRSEYAFLADKTFPSEDEQFEIYKNIVERMKGLPITIRTFDIGGDKFFGDFVMAEEKNPYLGCRAIRFSLKEQNLFKAQLRAILRASAYGNVSIMFPMVSGLAELLEAKALVHEVKKELKAQGIAVNDKIPVGCMIEVPSAALISDILAKECDFLSIGTNDLVQYTIAVDRGNHAMSKLYSPTHPSVLRLIKLVASEANYHGIPVTICGEIAADPLFTPLLLGLGVQELSIPAHHIPIIKNAIRSISIVEANKLAEQALSLSTSEEIFQLLHS